MFGRHGTISDAKRLKALEDENAKLKKLLAEHDASMPRPCASCSQKSW